MFPRNLNLMVNFFQYFFKYFLGSLIMPDCDDYSDLEGFNKKVSEFTEKKKTYNLQKKINLGKEIEEN